MKYIQNLLKAFLIIAILCQCGENEAIKKQYKLAVNLFLTKKLDSALKNFRTINESDPGYEQTNFFIGRN